MIESAGTMSSITLSIPEKKILAEAAHTIRFDNHIGDTIDPLKLLSPRRVYFTRT